MTPDDLQVLALGHVTGAAFWWWILCDDYLLRARRHHGIRKLAFWAAVWGILMTWPVSMTFIMGRIAWRNLRS